MSIAATPVGLSLACVTRLGCREACLHGAIQYESQHRMLAGNRMSHHDESAGIDCYHGACGLVSVAAAHLFSQWRENNEYIY